MNSVTLITGGARSGKTRYALEQVRGARRKAYIATAERTDDNMAARIERHRAERDASFHTLEEPIHLALALQAIPGDCEIAILDCLTVWLGNLMHYADLGKLTLHEPQRQFFAALKSPPCPLILIANEVGSSIHPETELGRRFRDEAGLLNQQVAAQAQRVVLMVCGLPLEVKSKQ